MHGAQIPQPITFQAQAVVIMSFLVWLHAIPKQQGRQMVMAISVATLWNGKGKTLQFDQTKDNRNWTLYFTHSDGFSHRQTTGIVQLLE